MTEKLIQTFNLPDHEEEKGLTKQDYDNVKDFDKNIKDVLDLSKSDEEMDTLAAKAVEGYDSLMTLGDNTEPRFASPIYEAATKLLGHAITAKTAKIDKKLKALDLKLKERRIDLAEAESEGSVSADKGGSISRNEMIEILRKNSSGGDK